MPIRVVFAEDSLLVREGVRQLLATVPEIDLVAVCDDRDSLLSAIETTRPDAVLTDIRMPPGNSDEGIEVAARLRETTPQPVSSSSASSLKQATPYGSSTRALRA